MKETVVLLTYKGEGLPIAYNLQKKGVKVLIGQAQDPSELDLEDKEEKDEKKSRLAMYDGILKKYPAKKLVTALKKEKNKDDYFIFCDKNQLWKYAEQLRDSGFKKGNFPTQKDFEFEKDRESAMKFVQENYEGIKIIPHQEFKTVDEAISFLETAEVPYVLQSEGDFVSTVVPTENDAEEASKQLIGQLTKNKSKYEQGEILLKEKLIDIIEITPQIVFYDGEPIYTSIDIETKTIGDGENNGNQVGCGTNLIIATELEDEINKISFPPKVYEMAKQHTGIFIWDISLYIAGDEIYFGEFCSNRFGYDTLMTEIHMSGGVSEYFTAIMDKENPFIYQFGTALTVFCLDKQEDRHVEWEDEDSIWMWNIKEDKDGEIVSLGIDWDLGVITGVGDNFEESVEDLYDNYKGLNFKEKYARSKSDFLDEYPTSIALRYKETKGIYYGN